MLVLAGLPLAILGRKRLPSRVWGRAAINASDRIEGLADAVANAKAGSALRETRGSGGKTTRSEGGGTTRATTAGKDLKAIAGATGTSDALSPGAAATPRSSRVAPAAVRIDLRPRGPTPSATAGSVVTDDGEPTRTRTRG